MIAWVYPMFNFILSLICQIEHYLELILDEFSWLMRFFLFFVFFIIKFIVKFLRSLYRQSEGENFMAEPYLELTKTDKKFADGTYKCLLKMIDENGRVVAVWTVCTGQGWAQVFRKAGRNVPGSMEPLPQGTYRVEDIAWAGGKDNWEASHGAGLGPVFVPVICPDEKRRGEFGIHMDYNRSVASSTAGCIGVIGESDMRSIVKFLRQYDPRTLKVDWGL